MRVRNIGANTTHVVQIRKLMAKALAAFGQQLSEEQKSMPQRKRGASMQAADHPYYSATLRDLTFKKFFGQFLTPEVRHWALLCVKCSELTPAPARRLNWSGFIQVGAAWLCNVCGCPLIAFVWLRI